jgi:hypothetical protein
LDVKPAGRSLLDSGDTKAKLFATRMHDGFVTFRRQPPPKRSCIFDPKWVEDCHLAIYGNLNQT